MTDQLSPEPTREAPGETHEYEAPVVEDLETTDGPAVTAAGLTAS
jgi:hypothetical protein